MDEATILLCVRATARGSAVLFASAGILRAIEVRRAVRQRAPLPLSSRACLVAVLVTHTVHFAFVLALAAATDSANIAARGGWLATSVVGAFFYSGVIGMLVARRAGGRPERRRARLAYELVSSLGVTAGFLYSYVGRALADRFFVGLIVLVVAGAIANFLAVSLLFVGASAVAGRERVAR